MLICNANDKIYYKFTIQQNHIESWYLFLADGNTCCFKLVDETTFATPKSQDLVVVAWLKVLSGCMSYLVGPN